MASRIRSGPKVQTEQSRPNPTMLEQEWLAADATDSREAETARARTRRALALVIPAALAAALFPAILPLTPAFSASDTLAAVLAAAVAAVVAIGVVPLTHRLARGLPRAGATDAMVLVAALFSAGAAAIHFAVAKMHFEEYTLFGVFFVASGIAQLVWPIWVLFRGWRPLFVLAAVGNAAIVALWAVDRIWGLPLGPAPWKPDPVGFGDVVTAAFELLLVAVCFALLVRRRGSRPSRGSVLVLTIGVATMTALSLLSVLGVASSVLTPTQ